MSNILDERLTKKQKIILDYLAKNKGINATQLVSLVSRDIKCSKTAVWNNLNSLKRCGLVEWNNGYPIRTSPVVTLLNSLKGGDRCESCA